MTIFLVEICLESTKAEVNKIDCLSGYFDICTVSRWHFQFIPKLLKRRKKVYGRYGKTVANFIPFFIFLKPPARYLHKVIPQRNTIPRFVVVSNFQSPSIDFRQSNHLTVLSTYTWQPYSHSLLLQFQWSNVFVRSLECIEKQFRSVENYGAVRLFFC